MKKLVVIDGLDGSGKATQAKILAKKLKKQGKFVRQMEYPRYESDSSALVRLYLDGKISENPFEVNAYASTSFYACDHYIGYKTDWERDYLEGKIIISDRYVSSNAIHQMVKLPKTEWDYFINWLYDYEFFKLGLPKETCLIYLDLDPIISQRLINTRCNESKKKDIHEKNLEYLIKCREAAIYSSKLMGWNVIKCDCEAGVLPVEKISQKIIKLINNLNF